jgi:uncharacterized membrane protein
MSDNVVPTSRGAKSILIDHADRVAVRGTGAAFAVSRSVRLPIIDALRGIAVVQLIAYHFIYDLKYYGWINVMMTRDQPWVGWRTAIVTQVLLLVGVSLALRAPFTRVVRFCAGRRLPARRCWCRTEATVVRAALHLVRHPALHRGGVVDRARAGAPSACGTWCLVSPSRAGLDQDAAFNETPANIIGFVTAKPRTEDYVPLFPWLGVVLIGAGAGHLWQRRGYSIPRVVQALNERPPRLLVVLGLWSLTVYLLHQPVMLGVLWVVKKLVG